MLRVFVYLTDLNVGCSCFIGWLCFPGVTPEKLQEGLNPRHCALSLVGEPIMYPEINALVDELHGKRISTFLVTNAQFPEKILMMKPITQVRGVCLYMFFHLSKLFMHLTGSNCLTRYR